MRKGTTIVILLPILVICQLHTAVAVATTGGKPSSHWNDNQRQLNVLMLTIQASEHTAIPLALGEELVQRGHNVTLCMSGDKYQAAAERMGLRYLSNGPSHDIAQYVQGSMSKGGINPAVKMLLGLKDGSRKEVEKFLKTFGQSQPDDTTWDVIIATDFIAALLPCLSERLQVPVIMLHSAAQNYPHTYPTWPWSSMMQGANTDDMTFGSRLIYAIERVVFKQIVSYLFNSVGAEEIESYCPGQTNTDLFTASGTRIADIVPTVIGVEFSRTISPLSQYVGPILTDNPEPCEGELETWLNNKADSSVIFISMGSVIGVEKEMADAFIEGIKKTNYSILWAIKKAEDFQLDIEPGRIYTDKWLP